MFKQTVSKPLKSFVGRDYDDYFLQVQQSYREINNPFWYYEKLVEDLLAIEDVEILPIREFSKQINVHQKKIIGFRHDIDADPITAVKCARALARFGLSGSFYLLHSAVYYGEFYDNVFIRNPKIQEWVKQIVIAGSEIGIHNDAIGISNKYHIDGLQHLKNEIAWLQSLGTNIYGTVAHNNYIVNEAENYEIFKEFVLFRRKWLDPLSKNIAQTTLQELGLEYEGTFAQPRKNVTRSMVKSYFEAYKETANMSNEEWTYLYFFDNPIHDWRCDTQIWIVGKNKWIIASKQNDKKIFEYRVPLSTVINFIKFEAEPSSSILFVMHPEYFGGAE